MYWINQTMVGVRENPDIGDVGYLVIFSLIIVAYIILFYIHKLEIFKNPKRVKHLFWWSNKILLLCILLFIATMVFGTGWSMFAGYFIMQLAPIVKSQTLIEEYSVKYNYYPPHRHILRLLTMSWILILLFIYISLIADIDFTSACCIFFIHWTYAIIIILIASAYVNKLEIERKKKALVDLKLLAYLSIPLMFALYVVAISGN